MNDQPGTGSADWRTISIEQTEQTDTSKQPPNNGAGCPAASYLFNASAALAPAEMAE
jgi:hypothetical protein